MLQQKIVEVENIVLTEQKQSPPANVGTNDKRSYLVGEKVAEFVSPAGNTLTLINNDLEGSNSCEGLFMTEEQRADTDLGIFSLDKLSCEVFIKTLDKELFYKDYELQIIGGEPYRWLDDTNIATHLTQFEGLGESLFSTAGIFNTQTESFEEILVTESPSWHGRRHYITYGDLRFIFVEGPETYNLYQITTSRNFDDFFSLESRSNNDSAIKTMVESLDPENISELELIGSIPHESDHTLTVTTDLNKNIIFTFGLPKSLFQRSLISKNHLNYVFDISANSVEPIEINWEM